MIGLSWQSDCSSYQYTEYQQDLQLFRKILAQLAFLLRKKYLKKMVKLPPFFI